MGMIIYGLQYIKNQINICINVLYFIIKKLLNKKKKKFFFFINLKLIK